MIDCVALTGAAGKLATALRPYLAPLCRELRLLDLKPPTAPLAANERAWLADLQDRPRLAEALAGCSAVVHFGGYPREAGWDVLMPANIAGVINLWEVAHELGVGRIVYASSNHAVGFYPRSEQVAERVHPMPDSRYGVTKVFMEALAQLYATKHGLKGFGLRIGHCCPQPSDARMLSHWIHPEDLAALVRIGLEADYASEIVYGASDNALSWWPNRRARELGFRPAHSADPFREALAAKVSADPVAEHFQGGAFAAEGFSHELARLP